MLFPALTTYGSVLPGFWQPHPCSGICFYFHFFLKAAALRSGLPKAVPGGLLTRREGRASSGFFSGRSRSLWQLLFSKSQAPSPSAVPPHNGPPSRGSQGLRHCLVAMETPRSEKQPDASDHAEAAYSSPAGDRENSQGRVHWSACCASGGLSLHWLAFHWPLFFLRRTHLTGLGRAKPSPAP